MEKSMRRNFFLTHFFFVIFILLPGAADSSQLSPREVISSSAEKLVPLVTEARPFFSKNPEASTSGSPQKETETVYLMTPLTLPEAAAYLRVSKSWLYQNKHTLPCHQMPGTRTFRFFQEELEEWLRGDHNTCLETGETTSVDNTPMEFHRPSVYHRKPRPTR